MTNKEILEYLSNRLQFLKEDNKRELASEKWEAYYKGKQRECEYLLAVLTKRFIEEENEARKEITKNETPVMSPEQIREEFSFLDINTWSGRQIELFSFHCYCVNTAKNLTPIRLRDIIEQETIKAKFGGLCGAKSRIWVTVAEDELEKRKDEKLVKDLQFNPNESNINEKLSGV